MNGASDNTIGGPAVGARNLVSGNFWGVVAVGEATGNLVLGNFVGTDVTGTLSVANDGNGIQFEDADGNIAGGTFPTPANVASGNGYHGLVAVRANSERIPGELRRDRSHRDRCAGQSPKRRPTSAKPPTTSSVERFPDHPT